MAITDLNIYSYRNEFEMLSSKVIYKADTFSYLRNVTRLVLPSNQFLLDGFSLPYLLDRN